MKARKTKNGAFSGIIGVARRDITPPLGIFSRNWGAGIDDVAKGYHRSLCLTCITFQSQREEMPLVMIGADLGWWKQASDEYDLRRGILHAIDIPEANLMVCLSHTHAGPSLSTADVEKPGGDLIAPYLAELQAKAIDAIREALRAAEPADLAWRYGTCDLATNRDLPLPEDERVVVGFNPESEADNTLLVGRVTDSQGIIKASIVNYACHPTTLAWENQMISPDYIGAMRELVEDRTGGVVLFLQGASGELAPAEQYVGDTNVADAHGRRLGYAVLATLEGMGRPSEDLGFSHVVESGASLAVWKYQPCKLDMHLTATLKQITFPLKDLPSFSAVHAAWSRCEEPAQKERLWRKMTIRKSIGDGDSFSMGLWVWKLGNSVLVGQPNEAYSFFQQSIRETFAPLPVSVINIVNGYAGYLPPKEKYMEDMYPVWQTPFAEGSLELLARETVDAIKQILKVN